MTHRLRFVDAFRVLVPLVLTVVASGMPPAPAAAAGAVFPVRLSADGRHLVDHKGAPFFVHGDTAWSLIVGLDRKDSERYLEDRRQRGYNALIVNLIEHKSAENPPNNREGVGPFVTPGDFTAPNEAYFSHADWVIKRAEEKGILVFLFPCYFGYGGGDEGFWKELNANGEQKSRQYGRFLGKRYRGFSNIVWVHGGDYSPPADSEGMSYALEILLGIKEKDPAKLHSFHGVRSTISLDQAKFIPYLHLNAVYTGDDLGRKDSTPDEPYKMSLNAYNRSDFKPNYLIEARYEDLTGSTYGGTYTADRGRLRRQAYWAILGGSMGHFFGNHPVWPFRPGWDGSNGIGSPGNQDMERLKQVYTSRAWHTLVPDQDHITLTAGFGSFGQPDYVTAGCAGDGSLVMAYVPPTGTGMRTLTLNMLRLSGQANAQWFNPAQGTHTAIPGSPFANSGSRDFTTPGDNGTGTNDWVLVLEAHR
jgi:hypothetical protein